MTHRSLIFYLLLATALICTEVRAGEGLNPRTLVAIQAMSATATDNELTALVPNFRDLDHGLTLLRDAVGVVDSQIGATPPGRAALTRMLHLALLLDAISGNHATATGRSLDRMDGEDVAALADATGGFPDVTDGLRYLLRREPSLRESIGGGEYIVIRLSPEPPSQTIFEMTTAPYRDLGPTWSSRRLTSGDHPIELPAGEHGETRRFALAALADLVLAGKAFQLGAHSSAAQRPYFTYIASRALAHAASSEQETIAESALGATINALREARMATSDPALQVLADRLSFLIPPAAFFARDFAKAASAYGELSQGAPDRRLWAEWGKGIANFAAQDFAEAASSFDKVASLLVGSARGEAYAYSLSTFIKLLPASERAKLTNVDQWYSAAKDRLAVSKIDDNKAAVYDFDFDRIMVTIGRTDLGLAHMIHRLDDARHSDRDLRDKLEIAYLREVAAFARDLCYNISFVMSAQGRWEPRSVIGYPVQLDFLHNVTPDGRPVGPGQIISFDHGRSYGMTAPEEDCVTVGTAYGYTRSEAPRDAHTTSAVANWALAARNRSSPAPSIAPYLKVVWVDWFRQAFEPLKATDSQGRSFVYKAQDLTAIAVPDQLLALKELPTTTVSQAALIDEFILLRSYLEHNYGQQ